MDHPSNPFLTASLDTIETNPAWVDGIRKWVKVLLRPRTYRVPEDAKSHVLHLQGELANLTYYLFYKVALFPRGPKGDVQWEGSATEELRHKVKDELDSAVKVLDAGLDRVTWNLETATPGTWEFNQNPDILEDLKSRGGGDWVQPLVAVLQDEVAEVLKNLDSVLSGRMLRAFNNWTKAHGGESHTRTEIPIEITIGKLRMVFDGKSHPHGRVWKGEDANPSNMADYVRYLEKTRTLLAQKGLESVWYGPLFVSCKGCGGSNDLGAKFGVGAHYVIGLDAIYLYSAPTSGIPYLLAHELGHRYYYKFMSAADRARFDSYFKDVPSVSEYGGMTSSEDFAEVFAHFVVGKNMSRDQIDRFKAFLAKKDRSRQASESRTACIIAAGVWDGKRSLLKNRDRNYIPKIKVVRRLLNGLEVLYMEDELTGWCEGLNEKGLGVVNSALAVEVDEAERKKVKTQGKAKDGERILEALGCKTIDDAVKKIQSYKGGLRGHTFVSTPTKVVTLEQTENHECKVTSLDPEKMHVRTNHGHKYDDAGYTSGKDLLSSEMRLEQAMKVLRKSEDPEDLATDLMDHRKKDHKDPNNMVRDAELYTTSQMVLDLTSLEAMLYLIPKKVKYLGMDDQLPKDRKPKIGFKVFWYSKDGEDIQESDPDQAKKARLVDRFLGVTPSAAKVASRFGGW